ncbi:MAG: hypothetical protein M3Z19_09260 [Chloroflexota bacterium]|nr:hypothetical protein [Chloroflexota bacterium]
MTTPQPPYSQPGPPPPGQYYPAGPPAYYPPPPAYGPPPKKSRRVWWIVGVIVGLFLLLIIGAFVLLGVFVFRSAGPARDATTEYFAAVKAHDWNAAQGHLSASLRARTKPADLQATWLRREQADGAIDHFTVSGTNVSSVNGKTSATVTATLSYASGASDPKIVTLVKEGDGWKLSSLP